MVRFLTGLLFLSGLPICMFVLPTSWWPWSTFVWFVCFIAVERGIHRLAAHWRGRVLPTGAAGFGIGIAIAIDDSATSDSGNGGDGGGDGGGGD